MWVVRDEIANALKESGILSQGGNMNLFEQVKAIPLSQYASEFTNLSNAGGSKYRGCCPIHGGDNNNAFLVDDDAGLWYCFSGECGGGSIIELFMKMNNLSAWEAACSIAEKNNIPIPDNDNHPPTQEEMIAAMGTLVSMVTTDEVMDYCSQRGLTPEIMDKWGIGLLPSSSTISSIMNDNGVRTQVIEELGIAHNSMNTLRFKAQDRLLFPIVHNGHPIAYSARAIEGIGNPIRPEAKYVNAPNSPIFNKTHTVFGEQNLGEHISTVVVVEGQVDAILLHENTPDDTAVIAVLGSTLTQQQWEQVESLCPNLSTTILLFDNDKAGRKAFLNAVWLSNAVVPTFRMEDMFGEEIDPSDMIIQGTIPNVNDTVPITDAVIHILSNHDDPEGWLNGHAHLFPTAHMREHVISQVEHHRGSTLNIKAVVPKKFTPEKNTFIPPIVRELMSIPTNVRLSVWEKIKDSPAFRQSCSMKDKDIDFVESIITQVSDGSSDESTAEFMATYVWGKKGYSLVPHIAQSCSSPLLSMVSNLPPSKELSTEDTQGLWVLLASHIDS